MAISAPAAAAAAAEAIAAATSLPGPRACLGRLHASSNSSSPSLGHHPRLVGLRASASGRRVAVACKAKEDAAGLDDVPDVAESTWDQLILGCEIPVLVEFWAPWCGPCCLMHPIIAKLAKTYNSKLKCFKLNTDNNQDVATKYGVRSIPTIMIFKNGEKKDTIIGAVPDATLVTTVERFL